MAVFNLKLETDDNEKLKGMFHLDGSKAEIVSMLIKAIDDTPELQEIIEMAMVTHKLIKADERVD